MSIPENNDLVSEMETDKTVDKVVSKSVEDLPKKETADETPEEASQCQGNVSEVSEGSSTANDPFAYIKEKGYTTEIFKIEILNLPKRFGIQQLRKKLHSLGLQPGKIKAMDFGQFAFVNFRSEEERNEALTKIQGNIWKGKELAAKVAKPSADPLVQKRKQDAEREERGGKRRKQDVDENLSLEDRLKNAVTPWWKLTYEEQLQKKQQASKDYLMKFSREVNKNNYGKEYQEWLKQQKQSNVGLACKLHAVLKSPVLEKYRNKCEFSVGPGPNGEEKTVGFRLGGYKAGNITVMQPTQCSNIPDVMKEVTKQFQQCLQDSEYGSFNLVNTSGHWHQLTVRATTTNEVMAFIKMHPQNLSEEELKKEKERVKKYFVDGPGASCKLSSLSFHLQTDREKEASEETLLMGQNYIHEKLLGLTFRISPEAFFQVNTPGAEQLYTQVAEWCSVSDDTVLLDVCCGTGTIGLTMAKHVKKVIGIEMCSEAIEDAKENAALNGITNAEFHCDKAENIIPAIIRRHWGSNLVAVVDPPRDGLHPSVVRTLRRHHFIERVVYLSCKPTGAYQNIIDLTRSESRRVPGVAFRLSEAVPVDLFPLTPHYELVMKFERNSRKKSKESNSDEGEHQSTSVVKPDPESADQAPADNVGDEVVRDAANDTESKDCADHTDSNNAPDKHSEASEPTNNLS